MLTQNRLVIAGLASHLDHFDWEELVLSKENELKFTPSEVRTIVLKYVKRLDSVIEAIERYRGDADYTSGELEYLMEIIEEPI